MSFDETFFNTQCKQVDYPHFQERAWWIKNQVPDGAVVYILGCGFGYLVYHLRLLGVNAWGIEVSEYAYNHRVTPYIVLSAAEDYAYEQDAYIYSWNMLDCTSEEIAENIAIAIYGHEGMHIVCTSGDFDPDIYYIQPLSYWLELFEYIESYHETDVPTSWTEVD